jgi:hypothetical protein
LRPGIETHPPTLFDLAGGRVVTGALRVRLMRLSAAHTIVESARRAQGRKIALASGMLLGLAVVAAAILAVL